MKQVLIVIGSAMIGFQIPEAIGAISKVRIPFLNNMWWALGCALLAAGMVL